MEEEQISTHKDARISRLNLDVVTSRTHTHVRTDAHITTRTCTTTHKQACTCTHVCACYLP